jgi:hypothetical protein
MQRTSESIAALAAVAKAEAQLINPEKSMVATIRADGRGAAEQIFRYARCQPASTARRVLNFELADRGIAQRDR